MSLIDISPLQLSLCLVFVLVAGLSSLVLKLGLEKDLIWGTFRTFAQLFLIGFVLKFIFQIDNVYVILLLYTWMIFWAAQTINSRVKEKTIPILLPTFVSMVLSYMLVSIMVTSLIVQVKPWYQPRYFIPIGGMIIGNSMNAIAIALERLFSDIRRHRDQIELALCLGATYPEATQTIIRDVIKAGMIPSINAMMSVGLVFLPGMMTGQILAGAEPMTAVRYQIIVMLMLVASTTIGTIVVVYTVRRLCFTAQHQLTL